MTTTRASTPLELCFTATTLIVCVLAFGACDHDDEADPSDDGGSTTGTAEPTLEDRLHALAECEATDATQLLPWTGPAFDPATGQLVAPLPAGHVEAVVNGWRIRSAEADALRVEHGMMAFGDVFTRDGLLGFQAVESDLCDISISHTLWRDEASMYAFVLGEVHARAMSGAPKMHHAAAGAHWTNDARDEAPTWQSGIQRMTQQRLEESQ